MTVWVVRVPGEERAAVRELAVRLAASVAGVPVAGVRLERAASGQPVVRGAAGVAVSLSHARGVVAAAAVQADAQAGAPAGVGVDVERIRPVAHALLARRWFTAAEAAWLAGLAPAQRSAGFLWLWTRKEAAAKALGQGLGGGVGLRRAVVEGNRWETTNHKQLPEEPKTSKVSLPF
ncbi:4'-phosphopantetheinyl transferase family protein, partial [Kitasatospora sp. LaBMicrA B282]|uniref:4'-phosphopantetheinyl transferase family protein n=1 Tax=Kitasatospora sp. LaBMicrA B282 TaxID=3420949 RepID=UPI003D0F0D58